MLIDVHAHYGKWPFPILRESESDLLHILRENEIDICIVSSSKAIQYDFQAGNQDLIPLLERNPALYGYIVLNPNYIAESEKEIEKYYQHPKILGIKMHPIYFGLPIDAKNNMHIIQVAEQFRLPMLIHTYDKGDTNPNRLLRVREKCPEIPIIMAHMGGNNWHEGIAVAEQTNNIYLDPICSIFNADKIREAIDRIGAHRMVFGTDTTLMHPALIIGMYQGANLTEQEQKLIFCQNALTLFPKLAKAIA